MSPQSFVTRLLFDAELRTDFARDRAGVLAEHEVEQAELFMALDLAGLDIDAAGRRQYLMSALCRAYPLSAAAIGSHDGGPERLAGFLASPHLGGPVGARTIAFGMHLSRLVQFSVRAELQELVGAVLAMELGLARDSARIRAEPAALRPRIPATPTHNALKNGRPVLPPHLLVVELPQPTSVIQGALEGVSAGDCWARVDSGQLSWERLVSVARAAPAPVTVLLRGVASGYGSERAGAGGVAPLVEVRHLRAELNGRNGSWLAQLGGHAMSALPERRVSVVRGLCEARLLDLVME